MSKKKYKSIACALAMAASLTTISAGTVYAAPDDEPEGAAAEQAPVEETAPVEQKRLPSPEEVDAMLAGQSPEMVQALTEEMRAKAERKGQQLPEAEESAPEAAETVKPVAEPEKKELPPIADSDIPVEMRTVKPEGYNPNALQPEAAVQPEEEAKPAEAVEAPAEETEKEPQPAVAVKPAEPVQENKVASEQAVKPAEEKPAAKPETEKEKKQRLKAEKKAKKEKEKQEKKARKEREKLERKAKKEGKPLPAEPVAAKPETKEAAPQPVQNAEALNKVISDWTVSRPSEQMIAETMEKLRGRTIVAVNITGASEETIEAAKNAVITRPGDYFSQQIIDKDREGLFDAGYFYDLYPTFQIVPEGVIVTYNLLENPVLTDVAIKGNTVYKTDDLLGMIKVERGKILNGKQLHENLQAIEERYRNDGYVLVKLSGIDVGRDGKLNLEINEGVLEGYTVKGNTKTKDRVIIREMRQKKGEPFNAKLARRGMQRVYNLGYFEDVNMKLNPGVEPNAVVLEIDVVERRTGSFTVGAGYSSRDGFLGMIGFGDKNFRGIGDSFNISYEFGGDNFDAHGLQFSYNRPWLDKKETSFGLKIYNRTFEFDDYDIHGDNIEDYMRKQQGFDISFSRPQSEYTRNSLLLRNRNDRYRRHKSGKNRSGDGWDPVTGDYPTWRDNNFGLTRSISFSHVTDSRDNVFNPTEGGRTNLMLEFAGFGGKFNYQKFSYEQTRFHKVGHAQVFAWRWAYGRGFGRIPEIGQYRLGGQETIRGYRDDSLRGNNMYLASLEYRFPIVRKVMGAIFTDAGAAWMGGWQPKGTHCSIGVGVAVETPIGPIRVDVGHGSQGNRVHFTVGGAF